jgi:Bacterial Ig domain
LAPAGVRVTATASDPDGDGLTYRWSAPIGRFANAMEQETVYTCPDIATTVALTVTVTDGHGGIASDVMTVHCVERR